VTQACNFLLAGVGGQGTILASDVLAEVALATGLDVKKSEVHGMAQRGGSVVCMVRWGEKVHSPLIEMAKADFLLAFELLEGLRFLHFLGGEGKAIVNDYRLDPLPVLRGDAVYPEGALGFIRTYASRTLEMDARALAARAGNSRAAGSCLLGALSDFLDFPEGVWEESIRSAVPTKAVEVNLKAFTLGRESAASPS
jgi:indolepyruvate ferredoxin oxidoreductase beta subunit